MTGSSSLPWSLPDNAAHKLALVSAAAARQIDRAAIAAGTAEIDLMERAGAATAAAIARRWPPRPVLVLAGPGNNGGDGFVVARLLRDMGWTVRVALLGARDRLSGAAASAAARWPLDVGPLDAGAIDDGALIVDALFGTGLARPLEGVAAATLETVGRRGAPVVAVDIPSGVDSDTGAILGAAAPADLTVTFFRRKPGHFLLPGRALTGELVVSDLGVPDFVYQSVPVDCFLNHFGLWSGAFPWPTEQGHKYTRGHALILGGTEMTGAARLAAHAAQRIGAGLVTVAADPSVVPIYAGWRADLLVSPIRADADFGDLLRDRRRNAVLLGPGSGVDERLRSAIDAALGTEAGLVLDADCFSILAERGNGLLNRLSGRVLLTPHAGEFAKLFGPAEPRIGAVRHAARATGAAILLKGSDTIIADPGGGVVINTGAPPDLATAGSGDVLAGLAVGLVANHLPPFLAGVIAAWVHGRAAQLFGPGLVASDLPDLVPSVLRDLRKNSATAFD